MFHSAARCGSWNCARAALECSSFLLLSGAKVNKARTVFWHKVTLMIIHRVRLAPHCSKTDRLPWLRPPISSSHLISIDVTACCACTDSPFWAVVTYGALFHPVLCKSALCAAPCRATTAHYPSQDQNFSFLTFWLGTVWRQLLTMTQF